MVLVEREDGCCGCSACANACPVHAITMEADARGFLYPKINQDICINCGKCKKVCSFDKDKYKHNVAGKPMETYYCRSKDADTVAGSRSGGTFVELSKLIFDRGGVVYGAYSENPGIIYHKRAVNMDEIQNMRGSKYVQSDMRDVYKQIKQDLKEREVMFVGTGCQVAGLYGFLGEDCERLLTVDLVCHGVPSPKIWKNNLERLAKKRKGSIEKADFRDKTELGWSTHWESYVINGKKFYEDEYSFLFYDNYTLRPSCFGCVCTNLARPGDLTIADGWGISKMATLLDDNKGVSLFFVNSEKGKGVAGAIAGQMDMISCKESVYMQPNLQKPSSKPDDYEQFWQDYYQNGYDSIVDKYVYAKKGRWKVRLRRWIMIPLLKKGIRR